MSEMELKCPPSEPHGSSLGGRAAEQASRYVAPLEWKKPSSKTNYVWVADTILGKFYVANEDGWYAVLEDGSEHWEWDPELDPRAYSGPHAAQQACQEYYQQKILSALSVSDGSREAGETEGLDPKDDSAVCAAETPTPINPGEPIELVERLQNASGRDWPKTGPVEFGELCKQAAAALLSLSSRVKDLEEQKRIVLAAHRENIATLLKIQEERDTLRSENETLKRENERQREFLAMAGRTAEYAIVEERKAKSSLQQIMTALEAVDNFAFRIAGRTDYAIPEHTMKLVEAALSLLQGKSECSPSGQGPHRESGVSGQQQAAMEQVGWQWWAGYDEERYTVGPFSCREDAISEGRSAFGDDVGFYITEAVQENPIDLARYIDADSFVERLCEHVDENCSDPEEDPVTDGAWNREQEKDLDAMLRDTVRAWQLKHNISLRSWLFQASRNEERIEPLPEPDSDRASGSLRFPDEGVSPKEGDIKTPSPTGEAVTEASHEGDRFGFLQDMKRPHDPYGC